MVFTTGGFLEVVLERCPELHLNQHPLNLVQTLWQTQLSSRQFNSHSEPTLYCHSKFIICSVSHFIAAACLCQSPRLVFVDNYTSVAESADKYGIHHWRILWSSYRMFAWVRFESTTNELMFKRSNWVSYEVVCSTLTQSQSRTATSFSSFVQYHISFWLFSIDSRHVSLIKVFCRSSYECSTMSWYKWYSPLTNLWSRFRKLGWVALEPATSEPFSETLSGDQFNSHSEPTL